VIERVAGSFRDPAGFVFTRGGVLYRQVNASFRESFERLHSSGLYDALVAAGLLIPHEVVDVVPADASVAAVVIRPQRVGFVSYPFEWSPGQLRAAAVATLEVQRIAMDHDMSLRDASAYNVQFVDGRAVLIDTLSFEPIVEGRPWVAYRQFCQHFLAPLALAAHVDVRLLQLLRVHLDGIPLDLAAGLLPVSTRLRPGLAIHIHAHAASQRRHAGDETAVSKARPFSRQAFGNLVANLLATVRRQVWDPPPSAWRDYYAAKESYSDESLQSKQELVTKLLGDLGPATVIDLGANTGRFSRIAAGAGAMVVAAEMDPSAVELNWREVESAGGSAVLPLWVDLANPTPAQGWAHTERGSLTDRGPFEVALALAVVHHIAIGNNVPLADIAAWFAGLARRLIVEWIPKDDPMVRRLLASREDIFSGYTQQGFEAAIAPHFTIERCEPVAGSLRSLYQLHSKR
jgi:hypothetical protein